MTLHFEDKRAAKRILDGDPEAFAQFFDEQFPRLYRFAIVRLRNDSEAARDVVQSTLTKALHGMQSFRGESTLFSWLCAICRNEISDWLRRQGRFDEHIVLVEDLPEVAAALDSWTSSMPASPESQYQRTELLRLIEVALDHLPARYGDVLEWKYIEGHSVREIAARLDLGIEATQSLLARARRAFADAYGTLCEGSKKQQNWITT